MAHAMEDPSKEFIQFVNGLKVPKPSNNITGTNSAQLSLFLNRSSVIERGSMGTLKAKNSL